MMSNRELLWYLAVVGKNKLPNIDMDFFKKIQDMDKCVRFSLV